MLELSPRFLSLAPPSFQEEAPPYHAGSWRGSRGAGKGPGSAGGEQIPCPLSHAEGTRPRAARRDTGPLPGRLWELICGSLSWVVSKMQQLPPASTPGRATPGAELCTRRPRARPRHRWPKSLKGEAAVRREVPEGLGHPAREGVPDLCGCGSR